MALRSFFYVAGLLLLALDCTFAQNTVVTKYAGKNLDAPLLVLDAASLQAKSPSSTLTVRVNTEDKCALICQGIKGCNAYVYCNNQAGCPGFCSSYVASNPTLAGGGADNYQFLNLPLTGFGAFFSPNSPNGCQFGDTTRYPFGLCSLKVQAVRVAPKFFNNPTTDGWNSGVISSTQPCNGLPFALCEVCRSLPAPRSTECLACAADVYSSTGASNLNKATAGWYCLWCSNPRQNAATCRQCLKENTNTGLPYLCV